MKKILFSISMLALAYTASANVPVIKSDPKIEAQVEQTLKKLTLDLKPAFSNSSSRKSLLTRFFKH